MGQSCSEDGEHGVAGHLPRVCQPEKAQSSQMVHRARTGLDHHSAQDSVYLPLQDKNFQVSVSKADVPNVHIQRHGWKSSYTLGPLLGDGISAKVYGAQATASVQKLPEQELSFWDCGESARYTCGKERGRRVALKRFHKLGTRTFRKELSALQRVGVHPHVLRLLESYEGFDGEDVLVLEYCDGSTVYDLYAKEHSRGGLPEKMVVRLIRQILLALDHLGNCGVEHQDVKPENMLLYDVCVPNGMVEMKLGDFGWATVVAPGASTKPPANGAGSLWYAPPELNPQPGGGICQPGSMGGDVPERAKGRSDMWSVGVVAYLLLVGHNPFNMALKMQTPSAVDAEVMRLVALGQYNTKAEKWLGLHSEARDFVSILLRVKGSARMSASEALHHPFVSRRGYTNPDAPLFFRAPVSHWTDSLAWTKLDGFQRLSWLAVARSIAEPEIERGVVTSALEAVKASRDTSTRNAPGTVPPEDAYLWELARELATAPVNQWLEDRPAWADVLRLAFCYLDLDGDGLLGPNDLIMHTQREPPERTESSTDWATICIWVSRWQDPDSGVAMTNKGHEGLTFECFRDALLSTASGETYFEGADPGVHPSLVRNLGEEDNLENTEEEIAWPSSNRSNTHRKTLAEASVAKHCM